MKPDVYDEKVPNGLALEATRPEHPLVEPEGWINQPGQRIIGEYHKGSPSNSHSGSETSGGPNLAKLLKSNVLDVSNVEMISSAVFRTLYGNGVRVPLRLKNVIDMDIAVENNDVTLNTNNVTFIPPKLEIWRFIFTYKNKPLMEYGRGISGIKLYYGRAFIFGLTLWWVGWKRRWLTRKPARSKARRIFTTTQVIWGKTG